MEYPETYIIEPVLGNQGYDAIVYDQAGHECDRIEIKKPHDGLERAMDGRLIIERGYGRVKCWRPGDELEPIVPFVLRTCKDCSVKDYSDCTLLVVLPVLEPFDVPEFEERFSETLAKLTEQVAGFHLRAKRVLLFIPPYRIVQVSAAQNREIRK